MNWLTTLGIAFAVSMDAFAVSVTAGLSLASMTPRHVFRLAFHFGLFQFLMPVIGWSAGNEVAAWIGGIDHWIAFALLAFVGGKMLCEGCGDSKPETPRDPTRGWMLVTLSLATSLDALAVGMGLAFLHASIWTPSIIIGLVTAAFTGIGIGFGRRIGARWGRWAEIAGGGVLILIGVKIVVSHLTS